MNDKKYQVFYLGHSAWVVETSECYLLFDIQDENVRVNGMPTDGFVDLSLLGSKPKYLFFSHNHRDHYSEELHKMSLNFADTFIFLGDFTSPIADSAITMKPGDKWQIGDIVVYTANSTDKGVCFLVQADGVCIFHSGDNADWGDGEQNQMYYKEIDYIAELGVNVNIAFIPVCTFSGQRPSDMTKGAIYAVNKLAPSVTFPMHANGREDLYYEFEFDLRESGCDARLICVKRKGLVANAEWLQG